MPTIDPADLSKTDRYRLIIDTIVPRPIAWITTQNEDGVVNLAPFSYFTGVTSSPPTVVVSIGARSPVKDTLRNLRDRGDGVVHLVPPEHLETVNQSGGEYASTVSETEELQLETLPSTVVGPPRLACAEVALECKLLQEVHVGAPGATLCVLEIVFAHIDEAIALDDGLPDPRRLRACARLGERSYLRGSGWEISELPRPEVDPELGIRR